MVSLDQTGGFLGWTTETLLSVGASYLARGAQLSFLLWVLDGGELAEILRRCRYFLGHFKRALTLAV
jgi:hypothetical protein